jgi:hypothetical protein
MMGVGSLFRELGHLPEDDPALDIVASGSSIGAAARRTYRAFTSLTTEYADVPRQLRLAARLIRQSAPHRVSRSRSPSSLDY